MSFIKKISFATLLLGVLAGVFGFSSVKSYAADYSINATTRIPLNYRMLELKKDNIHYRLASPSYAKFLKSNGMVPAKRIAAGTRIQIYNSPVLNHGGYKYYPVKFLTKKYTKLYKPNKGIFPTIAIKNFHQLSNMRKVK
ncbi:hypothetical protein [Apilactobacillus xinyiensis]|uniref:hypothetical protein n=1 Tax=Apilactobacillus xinyiensis TaxID=2841032 RepID=UPI00200E2368|nr:hypothetical protein [Apilactobacillus xinyiensis]MCL0329849.1 hypothetical protein [Apilactobacillus xinyiensis]